MHSKTENAALLTLLKWSFYLNYNINHKKKTFVKMTRTSTYPYRSGKAAHKTDMSQAASTLILLGSLPWIGIRGREHHKSPRVQAGGTDWLVLSIFPSSQQVPFPSTGWCPAPHCSSTSRTVHQNDNSLVLRWFVSWGYTFGLSFHCRVKVLKIGHADQLLL